MNINKIVADTNYDELCEAVLKTSHLHKVSNVMALSYAADPTKKKEHDSYLSESGGKLVMI